MARAERREWLLLAYRMPREPSTPRIAVWRKLRRLGAAQVVDGLVTLPASAKTEEQLGWVANEVLDAGGEASVWSARLTTARMERELVARMSAELADGYQRVAEDAADAAGEADAARRRTVERLRRSLRRLNDRDHFGPPEAERARRAVERLARRAVEA